MKIYVNGSIGRDGDGTKERPFRRINDAAKIARPGDEVLVSPGVYREYVDPIYAGTEEARIRANQQPAGFSVGSGIRPSMGCSRLLSSVRLGIEPKRPTV